MKLDPILLDTACRYSKKAYDKSIPSSIKIESKLTFAVLKVCTIGYSI